MLWLSAPAHRSTSAATPSGKKVCPLSSHGEYALPFAHTPRRERKYG
jgi:hypothetical protein